MAGRTPNTEDLSRKRCFHHASREAAARCPHCRRFFCRECVTEHDGQMVCAACLEGLTAREARRGRLLPAAARCTAAVVGLLTAWVFLYYLGRLLLGVQTSFHEGALWGQ